MEELFRRIRDENDIDKAWSMIYSGYILEPSYKNQYNCSLLFHAVIKGSLADVKIRTTENNCCVPGEAVRWATA